MKTAYTSPASLSVRLRAEGMMAASLSIGGEKADGTGEEIIETENGVLSNGSGNISSDFWNGIDE